MLEKIELSYEKVGVFFGRMGIIYLRLEMRFI